MCFELFRICKEFFIVTQVKNNKKRPKTLDMMYKTLDLELGGGSGAPHSYLPGGWGQGTPGSLINVGVAGISTNKY